MKIVIFLPNWIGDAVMATPTLRAIRDHVGPDATLVGVMRPCISEVLAGTRWLDEQLHYDPRGKASHLKSWPLVQKLRRHRADTVILLTNSYRTGLLAWFSGAVRRIGYAQYGRGPLLSQKLTLPKAAGRYIPTSAMDSYLKLAELFGCAISSVDTELGTIPEDEHAADAAWRNLCLPHGRRVVILNSGGAYGEAKSWPAEYFAQLATRIAEQLRHSVLFLCGPAERAVASEIVRRASHPNVKSLSDQPVGIGLSKACVRRSRLMVSTDSGPRHFAAAFNVPVITLYGPTHIAWGDNHYARAIHLQHDVPCGPCMKRVCPLGHHNCMRELTVDQVFEVVAGQLQSAESSDAA